MAKPPKKIPTPGSPDTPSTGTRLPSGDNRATDSTNIPRPGSYLPESGASPGIRLPNAPEISVPPKPLVVITDLPGPARTKPEFPADMFVYEPNDGNKLILLGNSGLSLNNEGWLYARIEHIGDVAIQVNANGQYEIKTTSQHIVELEKLQKKPLWQKKTHSSHTQQPGAAVPASALHNPLSLDKLIIPKQYARTLTEPDEAGIRRDSLKRTYVNVENNTTVMVQTVAGRYLATTARSLMPNGPTLERIEGTTRWRVDESASRPSKRPRIEESVDAADNAAPPEGWVRSWEPNPHLWRTWGKPTAETEGSIEVDGRHYRVFDFDRNVQSVAVIKGPESGSTFLQLELALVNTPWHQPVVARRNDAGSWTVSSVPLFDRSLIQSVADAFGDFDSTTSSAIARSLFEYFNNASRVTSQGWLDLSATLRQWRNRSTKSHSGLSDPFQLLPVTSGSDTSGQQRLSLPSASPDWRLQRVDFNISRLKQEQSQLATASALEPIQLFHTLLLRNGYEVFPLTNHLQNGELVFRRSHQLYFLKLQQTVTDSIAYEPPMVNDPHLVTRIGGEAYQALISANEKNSVIWLAGGIQRLETGQEAAFIIRAPAPGTVTVHPAAGSQGTPQPPTETQTVWNGRWRPEEGGPIQPFALRHSRYVEKFWLEISTWSSKNPFYPFIGEPDKKAHYKTLLAQSPPSVRAATSAHNIKEKIETFTEWGMKINIRSLSFFTLPGHVATEVIEIDGGLIAGLINKKQHDQPVIHRIIEPFAGSGFYSNYARAIGFEGEIITNDLNSLISWTQKEIVKQPDRVKYYIEFIKNDLFKLGEQNNLTLNKEKLSILFTSTEEATKLYKTADIEDFRNTVKNYLEEVIDVVVEVKNGKVIISEHSADPDKNAFLAAAFYIIQNNTHRNSNIVEIRKLANQKHSLHLPISVVIREGKSINVFMNGLGNTDHINYISHLHTNTKKPTRFLNEDGWLLLDSLRNHDATATNQNDLIILSGHFSNTYLDEVEFMRKIASHVIPLSEKGAKFIITNSYSTYKEETFNSLGFYTFHKAREAKSKGDYLLAINKSALTAIQNPEEA